MRWDETIDNMELGRATFFELEVARRALTQWRTCLVGEALRDAGVDYILSIRDDVLSRELMALGGGLPGSNLDHPWELIVRQDWAGLRQRLAAIRAAIAKAYPPPKVWEPAKEEVRELVLA